ncbi:MAG: hypothetical protein Q9P44_00865 [Anaerolineae bacterium]|nr:hypothetical protein [Anaerolineae bacterium]
MKYRSLLLIFVVLSLMIVPATISAQDMPDMGFCFGLDEADCTALASAWDNMDSLVEADSSFTVDYEVAFLMSGLSEDLPLPLPEGSTDLLDSASSVVFNSSGAIDLVLDENGEPQALGAVLDIEFGEADSELETIPIEIRVVDGYLYLLNPETETWVGLDLEVAASDDGLMAGLEGLPFNPMTGDFDMNLLDELPDMSQMGDIDIEALLALPGLISHVREGDDFIFTIDFTALAALLEPENADLFESIAGALAMADQNIGFMFVMLPSMPFEEGSLTIVQHVDTDLNIVDSVDISLALNVNLLQFMGQVDAEPIIINFDFAVAISNIGSAPVAVAPADFEEIDVEDLFDYFDDLDI